MLGVIGVLQCCQHLSKALGSSAVFGRTSSFSSHAHLVKGFISEQDLFQQKLVLPAVAEIVLVQ